MLTRVSVTHILRLATDEWRVSLAVWSVGRYWHLALLGTVTVCEAVRSRYSANELAPAVSLSRTPFVPPYSSAIGTRRGAVPLS